jgi:hypothetical protein
MAQGESEKADMKYEKQRHVRHLLVRPPPDVRQWLIAEAEKNFSTLNAEVIRSVRARMEQRGDDRREKVAGR